MKITLISTALAGAFALSACNSPTLTAIAEAVCTDAPSVQASGLQFNANQRLILNTIIADCARTSGGTDFSQGTLLLVVINDAVVLQESGLFTHVRLSALAPEQRQSMTLLKDKWEGIARARGF